MSREIRPVLTAQRLAWLTELSHAPAESHTVTGFQCRKLGWTEWLFKRGSKFLGHAAIEAKFGPHPGFWSRARAAGWTPTQLETLTDAGRAQLSPEAVRDQSRDHAK